MSHESPKSLKKHKWKSIYESRPSLNESYLVEEFYVPTLSSSIQYDRIAGYFNSGSLAAASQGIETLVENEGNMRLVVGAQLQTEDRGVLEALTDTLSAGLKGVDDEQLDARLQLLAYLLREGRLEFKIAVPKRGNWGIFHPKVGIFHDDDDNVLSFEGSINETESGWVHNYERFKVHRSWIDGQVDYVESDCETFERLWANEHDYVEVYDLPEALKEELIEWKAPDERPEIEAAIDTARGKSKPTEADKATILQDGPKAAGGLHLAEEASTVTPWPHQRVVSDTLLNAYPNSFLLCDEVGLGKTIEAGLTLSRLGLTGELDSGLILAPASLVRQWQEEMWEKFNLNVYRYERGSSYDYALIDPFGVEHEIPSPEDLTPDPSRESEAWTSSPLWRFIHHQDGETPTIIILSWHTARLSGRWDEVAPQENGAVRTRDDIPASCRGRESAEREGVWDAVIVDEAHNGRRGSNLYSLLERLRDHTHAYYLLTATPMQLHAGELYDLLTLLDLPEAWDDRDGFMEFFETRQALTELLREWDSGANNQFEQTSQATLGGYHQSEIGQSGTAADTVLDGLTHRLELEDEGRGMAKQRLMQACAAARDYGAVYDGYRAKVDQAISESAIDPFEAKEDKKLKRLLYPEWAAEEEMLLVSRNDRLNALDELSAEGWRILSNVLSWSTPVDALIHRNTRNTLRKYEQADLLDETVPTRNPKRRRIDLNEETRRVYDRIDDYTRKFYKKAQQSNERENRAIGFVMTTYRQRLTSSVYAISRSLSKRLQTLRTQRAVLERKRQIDDRPDQQTALEAISELDESELADLDDEEEALDIELAELVPNVTDEGFDLLDDEIEELESFVDELERIEDDPKIDQLFDDLQQLDRQGHNRVIVFTQYKDTMHFVRDRLTWRFGEHIACYSGDGGEMYDAEKDTWRNVGKERVKREFSDDDGAVDVMVCTNSASEGLNLQECGALINYDLPWNPMRVEQRIGRIDRIGQRYDEITILNYSYEDTVENDIYDRLDSRIGLFENVVGQMQPILSGVGEQIKAATLEGDSPSGSREVDAIEAELDREIGEQEREDSLELQDSLAGVETNIGEEVIKEARIDAWESYAHPDVQTAGDATDDIDAPYDTETIEAVLVDNPALNDLGFEFTPVGVLEAPGDPIEPEFTDQVYQISFPNEITIPTYGGEETVAAAIAPSENTVTATFSAECADAYPSLRFLAPGSPLLNEIAEALHRESEEGHSITKIGFGYDTDDETEVTKRKDECIVCGWETADGEFVALTSDGEVRTQTDVTRSTLEEWCNAFIDTRSKAAES